MAAIVPPATWTLTRNILATHVTSTNPTQSLKATYRLGLQLKLCLPVPTAILVVNWVADHEKDWHQRGEFMNYHQPKFC